MPLNLITDAWIPVLDNAGARRVIAPWQIADRSLVMPDWPRADLNLACYELLIGLVFLADPPRDHDDWETRLAPEPERLRSALMPHTEAFELMGDGPRFLQDPGAQGGSRNPPDMLFIDSAGGSTAKYNADLMVRRGRYPSLDLEVAAMALYTMQAFAPSGGAGNRTSMRGGGPLVTLVNPGEGLWSMIWANVPNGSPAASGDLPWMRQPRTSESGKPPVYPGDAAPVEQFFGMPRRLWLEGGDNVTGVEQRPWGTNYAMWKHSTTPYYRQKRDAEWLPRHPPSGRLAYRNWAGIIFEVEDTSLRQRAEVLRLWQSRSDNVAQIIVGGWSMDNMSPRDFLWSVVPLFSLEKEAAVFAEEMVRAATEMARQLAGAMGVVLPNGTEKEARIDAFWIATENDFTLALGKLTSARSLGEGAEKGNGSELAGAPQEISAVAPGDRRALAEAWLSRLGQEALDSFEREALVALPQARPDKQGDIVTAHERLRGFVYGYGKKAGAVREALGLPKKERKKRTAA